VGWDWPNFVHDISIIRPLWTLERHGRIFEIITKKRSGGIMKAIFISVFFVCITGFVSADTVDDVVRMSQERGIVSEYSTASDIMPSIWVRPVFHQMDFKEKRAIALAFFLHAKRQRPNFDYESIMLKDSRNNNQVGNYHPELGLRLKKAYR
jgi:hypothetical protein